MATCSNCGNTVEAADAFCSACGARTVQVTPEVVTSPPFSPVGDPPLAQVAGQPSPIAAMSPAAATSALAQISTNGWTLIGSAAAIFIGSLLPWVQASSVLGLTVSASPRSGGVVLFLILVAAALAAGWPVTRGGLSTWRWIGLTLVAVLLAIFAITNWADLGKVERQSQGVQVNAGVGLFLYTAGVVALWVCVVRLFLARRRSASTP